MADFEINSYYGVTFIGVDIATFPTKTEMSIKASDSKDDDNLVIEMSVIDTDLPSLNSDEELRVKLELLPQQVDLLRRILNQYEENKYYEVTDEVQVGINWLEKKDDEGEQS
jgi:hypothetical protein